MSEHSDNLLRQRCRNMQDTLTRNAVLRQGDPLQVIMDFVKLEMKSRDDEIAGLRSHIDLAEQHAGRALHYPWYSDDQKNFPGATKAEGVCIGEHTVDTIVAELAEAYKTVLARATIEVAHNRQRG